MASIERKWITNTATSPIYAYRPKGCPVFNSLWNFEYETLWKFTASLEQFQYQ